MFFFILWFINFYIINLFFYKKIFLESDPSNYEANTTTSGAASLNQVKKGQLPTSVTYPDDSSKATNQKQRKKQQIPEGEILTGNSLVAATQNQPIAGIRQNSQLLNHNFTVFNPATLNNEQKQKLNKVI